jgi:hypothetical protein
MLLFCILYFRKFLSVPDFKGKFMYGLIMNFRACFIISMGVQFHNLKICNTGVHCTQINLLRSNKQGFSDSHFQTVANVAE